MSRRSHHPAVAAARFGRSAARGVIWLVVAAVLNLLILPMHCEAAGDGQGLTLVSVCTEDGLRHIALTLDGQAVPPPDSHKAADHEHGCPLCAIHSGAVLPPPSGSVLAPSSVIARSAMPPALKDRRVARSFLDGPPSRASPLA